MTLLATEKGRKEFFEKIAKNQVDYREIVFAEHNLGVNYYAKPARARQPAELKIWRDFNNAKKQSKNCHWEQLFETS